MRGSLTRLSKQDALGKSLTSSPATFVAAGSVLVALMSLVASLLVVVLPWPSGAQPQVPEPPFAAVQYGTNGCIEVGVRPLPPYNQPLPRTAPAGFDRLAGYPAYGYDPAGFEETNGTNACRYNFRDQNGATIGSGYCVQWARGQRTGTGYDPLPWDGTIANDGYVRRILNDNWPATNLPAVPSTNATVINRMRSGAVAMAVHYFTDGIVMPPNYQDPAIYAAVADVVSRALAAGPLPAPSDPRPTIDGPVSALTGETRGPYTIGSNAAGDVTVTVNGGQAFLDAAASQPFGGGSVPPGTQLWVRSDDPGQLRLTASAVVEDPIGTLMVGDPTFRVQSMALAVPLTLLGKAEVSVHIVEPPLDPLATSQVSAHVLEIGGSVTDAFTVTGLGEDGEASLDVALYGPVAAPAGGCAEVDWAVPDLPVARTYDPIALVGDQTVVTDPETPSDTGCYSFGAVIVPSTGTTFTMPPGDPAETLRVVPAPVVVPWLLFSRASDQQVTTGERVRDRLRVVALGPERTVTIRPALLGPVPPVNGGCRDVDWVTADPPVAARFPAVEQTGSGVFHTPYFRVTEPGCYTYQASTRNDFQTGGLVGAIHGFGHPREILQVRRSTPAVHTVVSDKRVAPGVRFHDRVRVTGLAAGSTVTATAVLYGPFASARAVTCDAANRVRSVTWRARRGWQDTPEVTVTEPGVYTWQVTTGATTANAAARHRCGLASETLTVAKPPYPPPVISGGFTGVLPGHGHARQPSVRVRGSGFRLDAPVVATDVAAGQMLLPGPDDVGTVAWLRRSAGYGDEIGTAVIAGHVSDRHDRAGAMRHLDDARRGDRVAVSSGGTTWRYRVTEVATFDREGTIPRQYFRTGGDHRLVLVTCTRRVVYPNGHFHYTRYRVVVASPLRRQGG